jgi:Domain of unknown function (DUF4296)
MLSIGLLLACSGPVDQPKNLISESQMVDLMVDLAIYEKANLQDLNNQMGVISETLLKQHHIKAKDLEESYTYYLAQQDLMEKLYQKAQDKILAMDDKLAQKIKQKEADKAKENNKTQP